MNDWVGLTLKFTNEATPLSEWINQSPQSTQGLTVRKKNFIFDRNLRVAVNSRSLIANDLRAKCTSNFIWLPNTKLNSLFGFRLMHSEQSLLELKQPRSVGLQLLYIIHLNQTGIPSESITHHQLAHLRALFDRGLPFQHPIEYSHAFQSASLHVLEHTRLHSNIGLHRFRWLIGLLTQETPTTVHAQLHQQPAPQLAQSLHWSTQLHQRLRWNIQLWWHAAWQRNEPTGNPNPVQ